MLYTITFNHLNTRKTSIFYVDEIIDFETLYRLKFESLGNQRILTYSCFRIFTKIVDIRTIEN